jgi:hypothetical protein
MNNVAFITTMLPLSVLMGAVAVITPTWGGLPRALGWLAAVTAPALLVNGMFLDADFGPAFLLFLLWTLLASVVLTIRPRGVSGRWPNRSRPPQPPESTEGPARPAAAGPMATGSERS